jgi:cytidylate kinase
MFQEFSTALRDSAQSAGITEPPWYEIQQHRAEYARQSSHTEESKRRAGPYVIISRLPGAGGSAVAEQVGAELHWPVLGKELIGRMAQRFHVDPDLLEMLDENTSSYLYEAFGHLINHEFISQSAYISYLKKTVRAAAAEGPAVFVGRGTQYFLPRSRSLLVRVVADKQHRVARIQRRYQVDHKLAQKIAHDTQEKRTAFVRRYFHRELDDSAAYDLVVNASRLGYDGCAKAILAALQSSGLEAETRSIATF